MDSKSGADQALGGEYIYDARRYLFDVRIPAVLAVLALPVCAFMISQGALGVIAMGMAVICCYILFNTFVAKCYPYRVVLDDENVVFESFGRTDTVPIASITRLQVRENAKTKNVYVRINGGGFTHGRYFVGCGDMYDSRQGVRADDLFRFFLDTEARLHPDNLRVRARSIEAGSGTIQAIEGSGEASIRSRRHRRKKH